MGKRKTNPGIRRRTINRSCFFFSFVRLFVLSYFFSTPYGYFTHCTLKLHMISFYFALCIACFQCFRRCIELSFKAIFQGKQPISTTFRRRNHFSFNTLMNLLKSISMSFKCSLCFLFGVCVFFFLSLSVRSPFLILSYIFINLHRKCTDLHLFFSVFFSFILSSHVQKLWIFYS